MKTLLLIRHAKSSWENFTVGDYDRPLNDRGKRDAPAMAERLLAKKIPIDGFVSSPAKRALKTAEAFAKVYDRKKDKILLIDDLYHPAETAFFETIEKLDNKFESVAMFSHNPGITDFVNSLTSVRIDNIPTTGVFAVQADINEWKEFQFAEKQFLFFDYPRKPKE